MRATGAFFFHLRRSAKNRVWTLLKRLKQPRYLIGFLLTIAYFWWIFGGWTVLDSRPDAPPRGGGEIQWMIAGVLYLPILLAWTFSASGQGLIFKESEVEILFPAPLSRSELMLYKCMQAQFGILVIALVVGFAIGRVENIRVHFAIIGVIVAGNALHLQGMFANLTMLRWKTRGGFWSYLRGAPALALAGSLVVCIVLAYAEAGPIESFASGWKSLVETPYLTVYSTPLRWLAAPVVAPDAATFFQSVSVGVVIVGILFYLVLRADVAFEEQVVNTARRRSLIHEGGMDAVRRTDRSAPARMGRPPFRLAATGPAWPAFVWKNLTSIVRVGRRTWILIGCIVLVVLIVPALITRGVEHTDWSHTSVTAVARLIFVVTILVPSLIRVDLRVDILHFDVLKAMPVRGRELIFGEVIATTIVVFLVQAILLLASALLITQVDQRPLTWGVKGPVLVASLGFFAALDFLLITLENLIALHFPSFIRFGRGMKATGFDQMGQNILGALMRVLALMICLILPALVTVPALFIATQYLSVGPVVLLGSVIAGALIVIESLAMIALSEKRYESFDMCAEVLHRS